MHDHSFLFHSYSHPRESNAIFTRECPSRGLLSSTWKTSIITWTYTRLAIDVRLLGRVLNPSKPLVLKRRCQ